MSSNVRGVNTPIGCVYKILTLTVLASSVTLIRFEVDKSKFYVDIKRSGRAYEFYLPHVVQRLLLTVLLLFLLTSFYSYFLLVF